MLEHARGFSQGWDAAIEYLRDEVPVMFEGEGEPSLIEQAEEQRDRICHLLTGIPAQDKEPER